MGTTNANRTRSSCKKGFSEEILKNQRCLVANHSSAMTSAPLSEGQNLFQGYRMKVLLSLAASLVATTLLTTSAVAQTTHVDCDHYAEITLAVDHDSCDGQHTFPDNLSEEPQLRSGSGGHRWVESGNVAPVDPKKKPTKVRNDKKVRKTGKKGTVSWKWCEGRGEEHPPHYEFTSTGGANVVIDGANNDTDVKIKGKGGSTTIIGDGATSHIGGSDQIVTHEGNDNTATTSQGSTNADITFDGNDNDAYIAGGSGHSVNSASGTNNRTHDS